MPARDVTLLATMADSCSGDDALPVAAAHAGATPAVDDVGKLFDHLRKGLSFRKGCPGVAAHEKACRMLFCLAEANKGVIRQHMRRASAVSIMRDERQVRLLLRFQCSDEAGNVLEGIFGQAKHFGSGTATALNSETMRLIRQLCTPLLNAPVLRCAKDAPSATVEDAPCMDEQLFHHITGITRAICATHRASSSPPSTP